MKRIYHFFSASLGGRLCRPALLCGLLLAAGAASAQTIDSGTTGDCAWTLTGVAGNYTLTISGNGAMGNHGYDTQPWYSYQSGIKNLNIQQGVTAIGDYAFCDCSGFSSVDIPLSVTSIGNIM
jgi:hypothetical protein